jgi:predicted dehydrogenase
VKNIGIVGCAHIHTPGFVKAILNRSDLKVTKVWDPNPARSQKRAADLGAAVVNKDDQPYDQLPAALPAGFGSWLDAISGNTSSRVVSVREAA